MRAISTCPCLESSETGKTYAVKVGILAVRNDDIEVRIEGNRVTISADVKHDREEKSDDRVLRSQWQYGYASRTFQLGGGVDSSAADAKYTNGVLELKLPKMTTGESKRLAVG